MNNQKLSKLQFYSLGIVANNKSLNSHYIEVVPVEEFPMLDGEITDHVDKYKVKFKDAEDIPFTVDIKSTVSIKALWLPINNSNRRTSPDVRKGEQVVLYRFADSDEYWWNTLRNDHVLRRLETVIYSFSNMRSENIQDDETSTYFMSVSTHQKLIHLHTSKNDGEPFSFDIQINTKAGSIVITDDIGNHILLDSAEKTIHLENSTGSFVDINKGVINVNATETFNLTAKDINVKGATKITVISPDTNID